MAGQKPTCRTYNVDGQPVTARSARPLTARDLAALAEFQQFLQRQARVRAAIEQKTTGGDEPDVSIADR